MNPASALHPLLTRPLAFSLVLAGGVVAVEAAAAVAAGWLPVRVPVIAIGVLTGAVLSTLAVLVVTRLGAWASLGLIGRPARWRSLLWFLPFAIYGGLPLTEGADPSAREAGAAVFFGLLIAFWKLAALGLFLEVWLPRGARTAAALAALFWAGLHMGGLLTGGTLAPTAMLALSSLLLGFAFVAIRLRTGLLWPLVLTYALLLSSAALVQSTESSNLAPSISELMPAVISSLVLAVYGVAAWPRRREPAARADAPARRSASGSAF